MGRRNHGNGTGMALAVRIELILLAALGCAAIGKRLSFSTRGSKTGEAIEVTADGSYIKWVEFNVTCEAMEAAYEWDIDSYRKPIHLDWIDLLAYSGARTGGKFDSGSVRKINEAAQKIADGETTME